jgi:hypothetical protein
METRDPALLSMRGGAIGSTVNASPDEVFQNQTIRPILRLQNDLLIEAFKNYVEKYKNDFYTYSVEKKLSYIDNAVHKDIKFRNSLKGMVIALFTIEEYQRYIRNSSNLNKRMMSMVIERLQSQVQLFELHQAS